jgi:benzoate-CoA ligase
MAVAADVRARADAAPTDAVGVIPRDYNFAADIIGRNLKAGRVNKPVFIDPRGAWTYGQLGDRAARFAGVLRSLGVRREERVLIALLDTIDWPTAFLGCLRAGIVAVPVNTLMTEDDYRFMLADSRARVLVFFEGLFPRF